MTVNMHNLRSKVDELNRLLEEIRLFKQDNPQIKNGYYTNIFGSVLNAYREGDITFTNAVELLSAVKSHSGKVINCTFCEKMIFGDRVERFKELESTGDFSHISCYNLACLNILKQKLASCEDSKSMFLLLVEQSFLSKDISEMFSARLLEETIAANGRAFIPVKARE